MATWLVNFFLVLNKLLSGEKTAKVLASFLVGVFLGDYERETSKLKADVLTLERSFKGRARCALKVAVDFLEGERTLDMLW